MKYISALLIIILFGANSSIAQTSKGTQYLGLTVGFSGSDTKLTSNYPYKNTSLSLAFAPQYSYFIADNWELGGSVGYSYFKSKNTQLGDNYSTSEHKLNSYSSGLFIRRHIPITEKIAFRSGPFASYSHGKVSNDPKQTDPQYNPISKTFLTGVNLGIEFFPVKRVGLSADLADISYQYQKTAGLPNDRTSDHNFNVGLTNQLNLSVFLVF
ncbi:autotransporter outer membrane beta-barrel domain-containing protein [Arcticibacter eurypsychrophilus]|uniref:autotransporter outer membrane beta-barrel domain-containing protein n=1 Tax=Arcticibacter eurypsychrophilus TaxID=1434752 RepID=UPI00084DFE6E|nr:autotransporter outer membrane beta-barrel domain-containing protein [Arcticibacter eurypsychrophilus]